MRKNLLAAVLCATAAPHCAVALTVEQPSKASRSQQTSMPATNLSRRDLLGASIGIPFLLQQPSPAVASDEGLKDFVDPVGLFSIQVPQGFYTLRRSIKGDLPDEKTGKGRRGSSIFTAGNMAKAEVIAVERFPTRVLLEENGVDASGDLSTFSSLGEPATIASLITLRREKDKPGISNTLILKDSISVSNDGKELSFRLKSEIDVQKPELLMEQYGVSRLFRVTAAKASLKSNDGYLMAVFASALEQDFNGPDGVLLQKSVDSFQAMDKSLISS